MKKILLLIIIVLFTSACSDKQTTDLTASNLFTQEDASAILQFQPIATIDEHISTSTVRYDSDPIGNDPIIIEVNKFGDNKSIAQIYEEFSKKRELRAEAEDLSDFGANAFIAYPSLNIYKDGYMVVITAGSNNDEAQRQMLLDIGNIVINNLNSYLSENPTDADLLKQN